MVSVRWEKPETVSTHGGQSDAVSACHILIVSLNKLAGGLRNTKVWTLARPFPWWDAARPAVSRDLHFSKFITELSKDIKKHKNVSRLLPRWIRMNQPLTFASSASRNVCDISQIVGISLTLWHSTMMITMYMLTLEINTSRFRISFLRI